VQRLRRSEAIVFAGDRRVWRATALALVPLLAVLAYYCLRSRPYYTGTNSVEAYTYIVQTPAREPICIRGLEVPAGTGRIRLQMLSRTRVRPAMTMELRLPGRTIGSRLAAVSVAANRVSAAEFPITTRPSRPAQAPASLCVTASDVVNWAGTPLPTVPLQAPTLAGQPISGKIAVWYLPPAGHTESYLSRTAGILERAALFRPGLVGPWLYYLILFAVLPALALLSIRCLAVAAARGRAPRWHRTAALLYGIAAANFICWSLITPPFHAPDEVDHFAYTQSLVQRGEAPSRNSGSTLERWSSSEALEMEDSSFFTDHQVGDSRVPWSAAQDTRYRADAARIHPGASNGGGYETASPHGAVYYSLLAPAYALASSSPLDQLTLMRMSSALIGALTVVFAFLLVRELAPGREWLAVLAALLVAYQPMYGFISGVVNNDVGVNAGAAALELVMILILRRGFTIPLAAAMGVLLIVLPIVKSTVYSVYPVVAVAAVAAAFRHHRRRDAVGIGVVALAALAARLISRSLSKVFRPTTAATTAAAAAGASGGTLASGAISNVLEHPLAYLAYLWEVFLPRLSFMAPHFPTAGPPGFIIYVERAWGAFGWYDVFFSHWVYDVIFAVMVLCVPLAVVAARREWAYVRRNLPEALVLALIPIAVVAGVEAAYFTIPPRPLIGEFGRYAFPAIAPLAVLVVASLHAFGRRWALTGGSVLLAGMLTLSYAAQLVTLTGFYA
jgi:hypothetical protein